MAENKLAKMSHLNHLYFNKEQVSYRMTVPDNEECAQIASCKSIEEVLKKAVRAECLPILFEEGEIGGKRLLGSG